MIEVPVALNDRSYRIAIGSGLVVSVAFVVTVLVEAVAGMQSFA